MDHPLHRWLNNPEARRSTKTLAGQLQRRGRKASPDYLESIAYGYYPPGRKLALLLAEITDIPVEELVAYPYRAPRAA